MSRDDAVTIRVVYSSFRPVYHKEGRFWHLEPTRRRIYLVVSRECCSLDDQDRCEQSLRQLLVNDFEGLFKSHEWNKAMAYALALDRRLGYTEYGVEKASLVAVVDETGNVSLTTPVRRLCEPTGGALPRYSTLVFHRSRRGLFTVGVKMLDCDEKYVWLPDESRIFSEKRKATQHCLLLMDRYPDLGVTDC